MLMQVVQMCEILQYHFTPYVKEVFEVVRYVTLYCRYQYTYFTVCLHLYSSVMSSTPNLCKSECTT
jgi:hypothetical protein